jgi:hypothetical protein
MLFACTFSFAAPWLICLWKQYPKVLHFILEDGRSFRENLSTLNRGNSYLVFLGTENKEDQASSLEQMQQFDKIIMGSSLFREFM